MRLTPKQLRKRRMRIKVEQENKSRLKQGSNDETKDVNLTILNCFNEIVATFNTFQDAVVAAEKDMREKLEASGYTIEEEDDDAAEQPNPGNITEENDGE